jgi:hypothetical protein
MKKTIITIFALLFATASYSIEKPTFSAGLSVAGGVFEADGASEKNADATFNASEDDAEALYGIGSIFIRSKFNDKFVLGVDYVPHSLDTETTENVQKIIIGFGANVTNTVQIDLKITQHFMHQFFKRKCLC